MIKAIHARMEQIELSAGLQYLLLGGITIFALALRFYKLGAWSFWLDEVITVNATKYLSEWPLARLPINLVLIRMAMDFLGTSEGSARLVPTLIGVITLPALYFPIRQLFSPGIALISLLLIAISPWHLYWSQNARFYTLLLLLYNLGLFLYFIGIERDRLGYFLISILFFVLAVREKSSSFYFALIIPSYLALAKILDFEKPRGLNLKNLALVFVPVLVFILYDLYRVLFTNLSSMVGVFLQVFGGSPNHSPIRFLFSVIYRIGVPIMCLSLFGGLYTLIKKNRSGLFVLLGAVIPVLLLFLLSNYMFTVDRYVFITLPFWAILCAIAIDALFRHTVGPGKIIAFGVFVLVLVTSLSEDVMYYEYQNGNRPDWRGTYTLVEQNMLKEDRVFATLPDVGRYYLGDGVKAINQVDIDTIRRSQERIWFMMDSDISVVKPVIKEWIRENAVLVDVKEVNVPGKSMNIWIYLYDPRK